MATTNRRTTLVPIDLLLLLDRVFLPRNVNRMRNADPLVVEAVRELKTLVAAHASGREVDYLTARRAALAAPDNRTPWAFAVVEDTKRRIGAHLLEPEATAHASAAHHMNPAHEYGIVPLYPPREG